MSVTCKPFASWNAVAFFRKCTEAPVEVEELQPVEGSLLRVLCVCLTLALAVVLALAIKKKFGSKATEAVETIDSTPTTSTAMSEWVPCKAHPGGLVRRKA